VSGPSPARSLRSAWRCAWADKGDQAGGAYRLFVQRLSRRESSEVVWKPSARSHAAGEASPKRLPAHFVGRDQQHLSDRA